MRSYDEEKWVFEGCRHKFAEEVWISEEENGIRKKVKYKCPKNSD